MYCICISVYIYIYGWCAHPLNPTATSQNPSGSSQSRSELRRALSGNVHLTKHAALHILGKEMRGPRGYRVQGSRVSGV